MYEVLHDPPHIVCVPGHPGAVFKGFELHHTELYPETATADWHLLPMQQGFLQGKLILIMINVLDLGGGWGG